MYQNLPKQEVTATAVTSTFSSL